MKLKIRGVVRDALLISFVLVIMLTINIFAVTITTDVEFKVENETYKVTHTMNFHTITIDESYIVFNTTGFYISSGNAITVSLVYINSNIVGAGDGVKVLEFYANTISGLVSFGLSGFSAGAKYDVKRGGTLIISPIADGDGVISFSNSVWSTQLFEIFRNGSSVSDVISPDISSVILTHSAVMDTIIGWENISCIVTDNVAVDSVFLRLIYPDSSMINSSMTHKVGSSIYYSNMTLEDFGNYSYSIWADDTSGNSDSSSSFAFSLPPNWDINNDGSCTVFDFVLISNKYSMSGVAGWIREDVDNNGHIEVFDLVLSSNHYGTIWW